MSEGATKPRTRYRWTFWSAVVAIVGLIILTASGLCTGMAFLNMIEFPHEIRDWNLFLGSLGVVILFGGFPMAIGYALIRDGLRGRKKEEE